MNKQYVVNDKEFGVIPVKYDARARRFSVRLRNGVFAITVPMGMPAKEILSDIDTLRVRMRTMIAKHPSTKKLTYHVGQVITFRDCEVHIIQGNDANGYYNYKIKDKVMTITCPLNVDFERESATKVIQRCICTFAQKMAPAYLFPRAEMLSQKVGAKPKHFILGRGRRKLGHCTSAGIIQLSYFLMFLPQDVSDYITYHELAHLTYMNHSADFHRLCNAYCGGNEKLLESKLKKNEWCV